MRLLKGVDGIELSKQELDVWARANVRFFVSPALRGEDLRAVATEHTLPLDEEGSEARRIPTSEFARARKVLEGFVADYQKLVDNGLLEVNHLRRTRLEPDSGSELFGPEHNTDTPIVTATGLIGSMEPQIPAERSANNPAA